MNTVSPFAFLIGLLKNCKLSDEEGYLRAELPPEYNSEHEAILSSLMDCGYTNSKNSISNGVLYISRSSHTWADGFCPIFMDTDQFWNQINTSENLPSSYFIVQESVASFDSEPSKIIWSYKSFFIWKKLLSLIADYYQSNKAIVFITSENSVKKLDIPLTVNNSDLLRLEQPQKCHEGISKLLSLIEIVDPHAKERIAVLRTTLSEISSIADENENLLFELIKRSPQLIRKYDDLYDIYTRRFSVNKLLNELDEKSLEFTSKINEYISSSQNKALTIPGALIAIGALVKSGGFFESAIIFFGLWLIMSVTKTANDIYRESFDSLDKRLDNAFKKYLKFDEGKEVRESAIEIETELRAQIVNAKLRLNKIDKWALYMLIGGAVFLIISTCIHYNLLNTDNINEEIKQYFYVPYQMASIFDAGLVN